MKHAIFFATLLLAIAGVQAQSCDDIMLPYFSYDTVRMNDYPQEKMDWRCRYARNAFYESDTVPQFANMYSITDVKNRFTGESLPENYVVDLTTLVYYAYNFQNLQLQYRSPQEVLCFRTPSSTHPYLVLRSIGEMHELTERQTYNPKQ